MKIFETILNLGRALPTNNDAQLSDLANAIAQQRNALDLKDETILELQGQNAKLAGDLKGLRILYEENNEMLKTELNRGRELLRPTPSVIRVDPNPELKRGLELSDKILAAQTKKIQMYERDWELLDIENKTLAASLNKQKELNKVMRAKLRHVEPALPAVRAKKARKTKIKE